MYYAIGDSHATVFNYCEGFDVGNVSPGTAFNLLKPKSTSGTREKVFERLKKVDKTKDTVIFAFGEIDCRIHIYYQHEKQNVPIPELVEITVQRYGKFLQEIRKLGYRIIVQGIPPAGWQPNIQGYPSYATPEIHAFIYRTFNATLKFYCRHENIPYLDIYAKTVDPSGHMQIDYASDEVHLNEKAGKILVEMIRGIENGTN